MTTLIPPVDAGTITSCIDIEYDESGNGSFTAVGEHTWQFDEQAFYAAVPEDVSVADCWIPQRNGHSLRIVRELRTIISDGGTMTVFVEEYGVRGTTSTDHFWLAEGGYDVNSEGRITNTYVDREPDVGADVTVDGIPALDGTLVRSPTQWAIEYHMGAFDPIPPIRGQLSRLVSLDTFDHDGGAVPLEHYLSQQRDGRDGAARAD